MNLCASNCWPSSNARVTSANSLSFRKLSKAELMFSLKSFHCKRSFTDITLTSRYGKGDLEKRNFGALKRMSFSFSNLHLQTMMTSLFFFIKEARWKWWQVWVCSQIKIFWLIDIIVHIRRILFSLPVDWEYWQMVSTGDDALLTSNAPPKPNNKAGWNNNGTQLKRRMLEDDLKKFPRLENEPHNFCSPSWI